MKEKLILIIADMFREFSFIDPIGMAVNLSHEFIVKIPYTELDMDQILKLIDIKPFDLNIERDSTCMILKFQIKA